MRHILTTCLVFFAVGTSAYAQQSNETANLYKIGFNDTRQEIFVSSTHAPELTSVVVLTDNAEDQVSLLKHISVYNTDKQLPLKVELPENFTTINVDQVKVSPDAAKIVIWVKKVD